MERLQKILAQAGIASRRKCEEIIAAGRVTINGVVQTELGTKADPAKHRIEVDGKPISIERKVCLMLHKPTSYVTTVTDPEGRRTVMSLVEEVQERLYPVGRLDYDTSGLLLLTNDGDLTERLLHPSHELAKVYRVTVLGMPEKATVQQLRSGIQLEDGMTKPAEVRTLRHHPRESVLEITIYEGRNRQVRRMFDAVGHPVKRLKRVQFGPLKLDTLQTGKWRYVTEEEWKELYLSAELTPPAYTGDPKTKSTASTGRDFAVKRKTSKRSGNKATGPAAAGRQRRRSF